MLFALLNMRIVRATRPLAYALLWFLCICCISSRAISTMCLLHQSNLLAQNVWFTTFNIHFQKEAKEMTKTHGHQSQILKRLFSIETANFGWLRNRDKIYKWSSRERIKLYLCIHSAQLLLRWHFFPPLLIRAENSNQCTNDNKCFFHLHHFYLTNAINFG